MFSHEVQVRVRYGETDRMGYMYYGAYPLHLEVGRVEALRSLGFPYKELEDQGILLPVRALNLRYHAAARYDDLLTIRTSIAAMPGVRMEFVYRITGEGGALLTEGSTTLVFVDRATGRPRRAPEDLCQALAPYFPSA